MSAPVSAKQVQEAKPIPDTIPITVLSAGKQSEEWQEQQLLLCNLNSITKHKIANESWHSIRIQPKIVISAIKEMIYRPNPVVVAIRKDEVQSFPVIETQEITHP